jgi:hypothetical protein
MALALVQQSRGAGAAAAAAAEQQARLRQVHALKQLGQNQVGLVDVMLRCQCTIACAYSLPVVLQPACVWSSSRLP